MKRFLLKKIRAAVRDAAYQFRMGAGFPGDVNTTHPASIDVAKIAVATPPTIFGQALLLAAANAGVRPFTVGDTGVTVAYGLLVRPFPIQAPAGSSNAAQGLGAATPPSSGACDVMRSGRMMVQLNVGSVAPVQGGAVFVWCAATAGNNIQGGFGTAANGGNTAALDVNRYQFNGGMDANSVAEISFNE